MKSKKIRHYEDLTEDDILYGFNNYFEKEKKLDELTRIKEETDNKIKDLRNYLDVIGRVTHVYENVPVIETYSPFENDILDGNYSLSTVTFNNQRKTEAYLLGSANKDNWKDMWVLSIEDYLIDSNPNSDNKGLPIGFVKFISYKYIIKKVKIEDIINNLPIYFEEYLENS